MLATMRAMPSGVRLFLVYAVLILAAIGISLPTIVAMATGAPVSFTGVVVMILLAYTIFATTLVLQRKEAGRPLALGLASLTVPTALVLLAGGAVVAAAFVGILGVLLFRGLVGDDVRAWLSEP